MPFHPTPLHLPFTIGIGRAVGPRVAIALALLCGCGARSEIESAGAASEARTPETCHDGGGVPGCVLHAYDVDGADLGATTLSILEDSAPGSTASLDGYWIVGLYLTVYGGDGEDRYLQIKGDQIDALTSGSSLPLAQAADGLGPNYAAVSWWGTGTDYWTSTTGTLDVVAFDASPSATQEVRPIQLEACGVPMSPAPDIPGSAPNHATGTFTMDLSCRLEKFQYIPLH